MKSGFRVNAVVDIDTITFMVSLSKQTGMTVEEMAEEAIDEWCAREKQKISELGEKALKA